MSPATSATASPRPAGSLASADGGDALPVGAGATAAGAAAPGKPPNGKAAGRHGAGGAGGGGGAGRDAPPASWRGDGHFMMAHFKVLPCQRRTRHQWRSCPFVHDGELVRRRPLQEVPYAAVMCAYARLGQDCPMGEACTSAHNGERRRQIKAGARWPLRPRIGIPPLSPPYTPPPLPLAKKIHRHRSL